LQKGAKVGNVTYVLTACNDIFLFDQLQRGKGKR